MGTIEGYRWISSPHMHLTELKGFRLISELIKVHLINLN